MTTQHFAMIMGIVYVLVGILGIIPGVTTPPAVGAPDLVVNTGYGYVLGLFPVNILHNFVHLGIGIWGLSAYRSMMGAKGFAQGLAIFYGVLAVMGLIPVLNTTFGLIPIFGHDIWLHAVTAAAAAYFGYAVAPAAMPMEKERISRRAS